MFPTPGGGPFAPRLYCAVCLQVHRGTSVSVGDADTIVEGIAVCYDHLGSINSPKLSNAVHLAKLQEATRPPRVET